MPVRIPKDKDNDVFRSAIKRYDEALNFAADELRDVLVSDGWTKGQVLRLIGGLWKDGVQKIEQTLEVDDSPPLS